MKLTAYSWSGKERETKCHLFSPQMASLCSAEPQAIAAVGRSQSCFHCCQSHCQTPLRKPTSHTISASTEMLSCISVVQDGTAYDLFYCNQAFCSQIHRQHDMANKSLQYLECDYLFILFIVGYLLFQVKAVKCF